VCVWTLHGFRFFVLHLADKNVRAKLMNEHGEWVRAIMCPKLAAEGLEDSEANCEVSLSHSSVLLLAAAAYICRYGAV
jgi:hypothetical protein